MPRAGVVAARDRSLQLVATPADTSPPRYRIVHSLPGRVRVRLSPRDADEGGRFAEALSKHPAVHATRWVASVRSLTVSYDPEVSFADVVRGLGEVGAPPAVPSEPRADPVWRQFLLPAVSMAAALSGAGLPAQVAIGICAAPIYRRAARSLMHRHVSIDVLDGTAMGLLIGSGDVLAAGVSVSLIEVGERLRKRASGRARRVLRGWMGADARGVRLQLDGTEPRVPLNEVQPGNHVVIYAGENIPVDGTVIAGTGSVDSKTWTGEPIPKEVNKGQLVLAGSALADGRLVLEVTATGDHTRAGRLAIALEDAIAADTRVSDMARRVADRFVIPVFLAGGLVFGVTRDLSRLVSMLIVDFGTGVRLSIPTTILTTMITGARHEVLFKQGRGIEELARVDTIVFDKTGTLTTGRPSVVDVIAEAGFDASQVLRLAAAAEGHLPHPIARAIRRYARRRELQLPQPEMVRYQAGGGVVATMEGHAVVVGDRRLLEVSGIRVPSEETAESSVAFIAVDDVFAARIRLRDSVKPSARQLMVDLRRAGVSQLLLATGDHPGAARAVAHQLGLDSYRARMMPEEKAAFVRSLREAGRQVAVVGDGINDAAAMAEANVGIAVPQGADLARETAEVVLLGEDLGSLVAAVRLSQNAMTIIRQNVGLVAAPNGVGMALAMAGRLTPLTATFINNGSTLFAEANALRPLRTTIAGGMAQVPGDAEG